MKHRLQSLRLQSHAAGYALSSILLILLLVSTYVLYSSFKFDSHEANRRAKLLSKLALARDTLIAYAATDPKRPGRLLCPDQVGDGISPLLTGDDCPSYNGWLPWKTLDLPGEGDDRGQAIRYVISPLFGGDRNSPPLNSDTATSLSLDTTNGKTSHGIAGLLIATRGPLDRRNADGDNLFFNGQTGVPDDNDVVIAITREQLMSATEQRIANQLRACLSEHVSSSQNLEQSFPWPAPPGKTNFQGNTGSLFGRFPETQAGNPEALLQAGITRLAASKTRLDNSSTTPIRIQILRDIEQQVNMLRAQFDRLYLLAVEIETRATQTRSALASLDNQLANSANASARIAALAAGRDALSPFIAAIEDSGFDFFEQELTKRNGTLKIATDNVIVTPDTTMLSKLATAANDLKSPLLSNARTPNPDLQMQADDNRMLATQTALAATQAKAKPDQISDALALARQLFDANSRLSATIRGLRINLDPIEIRYRARRITDFAAAFSSSGNPPPDNDLARTLSATRTLLKQAPTGIDLIQQTLAAIDAALEGSQTNSPTAIAASIDASSRLLQLATWLEGIGDNIGLETLRIIDAAMLEASRSPALSLSDTTSLRTLVAMAIFWSEIASTQATEIARRSRKTITAKDDSDSSAYTSARRLIDSLDGTSDSIALLEKFNTTPSVQNRDNAERALASSQARLIELLDASNRLDTNLSSGQAKAALPVTWLGSTCSFIQSNDTNTPWWFTQGWKNLFFYQISDRIRPDMGRLTLNNQGKYPFIVIGAGPALPGRQSRGSSSDVSQFLEARNTHPSREGMAIDPIRDFSKLPLSLEFNDQLAY